MSDDKKYTILVAEDENFQRLALMDILQICEYDCVAVENGKLAIDQLRNECNDFDLLLLDLQMPEMNGFEVLSLMQEDERLSQIPVVVMSSADSNETISDCLKLGALNYIVKPVRLTQCKSLIQFMKTRQQKGKQVVEEKGLARFENLRFLGNGAAGRVDLIRNKKTSEQFALKTINLQYLSEKDKKSAECEVEFLRVITGPTIIKFHESFVEKQNIYIVMEYAEGGSLAQLIQKHSMTGKRMSEDQILMYTAQITLSLLALHSKSILHRDIKTQNIFIKAGVLKLGDFGISKSLDDFESLAQTQCGTPYFMPPEVCKRCPYDSKADVWAMGVIIYELITLKKPFDSEKLKDLFDLIITKPVDPLPEGTSADLQLLIKALLNKDKDSRPTIFSIARIPCVKKKILQFIEEYNCKDEVMPFFDFEPINKAPEVVQKKNEKKSKKAEDVQVYVLQQLEDWAEIMHLEIEIKDYPNGWLQTHKRCARGQDIYGWILEHAEQDQKKGAIICQKMLEKSVISAVDQNQVKIFNINYLYRFYADREDIADNMVKKWNGEVGDPLKVAENLVTLATDLYQQAIVEEKDEDEGEGEEVIDGEAAFKSAEFKKYINASAELEKVEILGLSQEQKVAFFLNVYQCMYVHYFLKLVYEQQQHPEAQNQQQKGLLSSLTSYVFKGTSKPFYYKIGPFNFSLEEIKHGLLRNNKKAPINYLKTMSSNDDRLNLLRDYQDPRINFICLDYPTCLEHIDQIDGSSEDALEQSLNDYVSEILQAKVNIDTDQGEITLPQVLNTYRQDFGQTDENIMLFVFRYLEEEYDQDQIIRQIKSKNMLIAYES